MTLATKSRRVAGNPVACLVVSTTQGEVKPFTSGIRSSSAVERAESREYKDMLLRLNFTAAGWPTVL